ncbi:hypothetical protein SBF1_1890006 [Candidatus Desulfosporosinus infrequens]|uniref:Uncharacterized protein n=1 Tax=Candidatus Desulfosporosinus infrequens TaxID=2043169 RepID=A0A2U3KE81_9FIRM|nr:hypothetical protein SBF1_1890006 [Candidatus Desulfosporosinus infrequens]
MGIRSGIVYRLVTDVNPITISKLKNGFSFYHAEPVRYLQYRFFNIDFLSYRGQ